MKIFVSLITCLVSFTTLIRCRALREGERKCGVRAMGDAEEKCLPRGGGYVRWECTEIDPWMEFNIWIEMKTTICPEEKASCECFENDWYEQECECVHPSKPPSFPPTGVIRWNGTYHYDDSWWVYHENPRTVYMHGEVHKNKNGSFLLKESKVIRWPNNTQELPNMQVEFEIIIPSKNGKEFIKYTGDDSSKVCRRDKLTSNRQLSSIWEKSSLYGKSYHLMEETSRNGGLSTQKWKREVQGEDWDEEWTWTVEYDSEIKYAFPIKYKTRSQDGFGGVLEVKEYNYAYESTKDGETFRLRDYCSGV